MLYRDLVTDIFDEIMDISGDDIDEAKTIIKQLQNYIYMYESLLQEDEIMQQIQVNSTIPSEIHNVYAD